MHGTFIRVKHDVLDKDGNYICKLILQNNAKVADKELSLENLAEILLLLLEGLQPEEEQISFALQVAKEELQLDMLDPFVYCGDSKLISFEESFLNRTQIEELVENLNNTLFEIII